MDAATLAVLAPIATGLGFWIRTVSVLNHEQVKNLQTALDRAIARHDTSEAAHVKAQDDLRAENKQLSKEFYLLRGANEQVASDLVKARDLFVNQTVVLKSRDQEIADLKNQLRTQSEAYEAKIKSLEDRVAVLEGQKAKAAIIAQEGIDHPVNEAQEASEAK